MKPEQQPAGQWDTTQSCSHGHGGDCFDSKCPKHNPQPAGQQTCENTDRELWREREGDYYADSIHVTKQGGIGINCGGSVFVKPLREWHRLAGQPAGQTKKVGIQPRICIEGHDYMLVSEHYAALNRILAALDPHTRKIAWEQIQPHTCATTSELEQLARDTALKFQPPHDTLGTRKKILLDFGQKVQELTRKSLSGNPDTSTSARSPDAQERKVAVQPVGAATADKPCVCDNEDCPVVGIYKPWSMCPKCGSLMIPTDQPTSGKQEHWTPEMLSRLFDKECSPEEAIKRICALHESSIKAEREKADNDYGLMQVKLHDANQENQQLREQLAAAQAAMQNALMFLNDDSSVLARVVTTVQNIFKSDTTALDAAIAEAIKKHASHISQFLSELYAIMVDPLADGELNVSEVCPLLLKRAREDRELAAAQQPLVDALKQANDFVRKAGATNTADAFDELLAKVKEGKS